LVDAGVLVTINPDDPAMWEFGDEVYNLYFLAELYGYEFVKKVIKVSARLTV
jgi:adenosine deaminase